MSKKTKRPTQQREELAPGSHNERSLRARITDLEDENRVLRARANELTPLDNLDYRTGRLVRRFIQTMVALDDLGDPRSSNVITAQTRTKHANSEIEEGRNTAWARDLKRRLTSATNPLLNEFESRMAGTYKPPPRPEKVRCRNDDCDAVNRRIPKYVGSPKQRIELVRCPSCDHRLTPV